MRVLWGVLLAGGSGAFTVLLIADSPANGPKYTPEMLGQALPMSPRLTTLGVFCSGLALGFIFCVGIWLLVAAATRHKHRAAAEHAASRPDLTHVQPRFIAPPAARPVTKRAPRPERGKRSQRGSGG